MSNQFVPSLSFENTCKDNERIRQLNTVFEAFFNTPCTMLMAAKATKIERANICRHIDNLKKINKIAVVKRGYCQITQYRAGYYTTNPALFPPTPKQLHLF